MTRLEAPHPRPDWRVGDAERAHACEALGAHHALGRLSPGELDDRLEAAVGATTRRELDRLLHDLPPLTTHPTPTPPATAASRQDRPTGPLRDTVEAMLLMGALGSAAVVALMLAGSVLLGVQTFVFALVGGSLTLFFTAVITRALCGGGLLRRQRPQHSQQFHP